MLEQIRGVSAAEVERSLAGTELIERLRRAFAEGAMVPPRHHHSIAVPGGKAGTLLLMPAWQASKHIGVKVVTVFPDNVARTLPSVIGVYLLLDAKSGEPRALIDGTALTLQRTAAASALAATFLAREDASHFLLVGAGSLAPHLAQAHAGVRPLSRVTIWNRTAERAERLAEKLRDRGLEASATRDLAGAARTADIISCATLSPEPLIRGDWLKPGAHLDLVGGFTPRMREADDEAVRRARIFVDTRAGAGREAGDIVDPMARGVIAERDIQGDLFELCRGQVAGRRGADEITLFKSVGTALEDLAAAELVMEKLAA